MVIDRDTTTLKSMNYFDYNQNVEYYIEHIASKTRLKEMLPDCCKSDIQTKVQNMPERHENRDQKTDSSVALVSTGERHPI